MRIDREDRKILDIKVSVDKITAVEGKNAVVRMVEFSGSASGDFFSGLILPGGVDTQIERNGATELSARYILEGKDFDGNQCRIFIENNGYDKDGKITAKPKLFTDSPSLKFLEDADLTGSIAVEDECLTIKIFGSHRGVISHRNAE